MKTTMNNFIGIFDDAVSHEVCDEIISIYEESQKLNYTLTRQDIGYSHQKADNSLVFADKEHMTNSIFFSQQRQHIETFVDLAWKCYHEYAKKYGILNSLRGHRFYDDIKIQKTEPSGGYHVWHCEHDGRTCGSRLLLVMLYLNDVEEGGETEFLYQSLRVKPKKGTIVICPSGFTHTHRGNPPLSGDKFMINGWIEFEE
jgi:hypothetical protein